MTDMTLMVGALVLILGVSLTLWAGFGKKVKMRTFWAILGILLVLGGGYSVASDVGLVSFTVADLTEEGDEAGDVLVIDTFSALFEERGSGSYTNVDGQLRIYGDDADPGDANTEPIATMDINSGQVSYTGKLVKTDTDYRVVYYDNSSTQTWYTYDFGIMQFDSSSYNTETGNYLFDTTEEDVELTKISTFLDIIEEDATDGTINGQSNVTDGSGGEIVGDETPADGETLFYDESDGDGEFYLKINVGASGANTWLDDVVFCVEWDSTKYPEGNEVSSITLQHDSGANLVSASDFTNYFKNEACLPIGEIGGGDSEVIKMIIAYSEANLDSNDDYSFVLDDLGDVNGKGLIFLTGATKTSISMSARA